WWGRIIYFPPQADLNPLSPRYPDTNNPGQSLTIFPACLPAVPVRRIPCGSKPRGPHAIPRESYPYIIFKGWLVQGLTACLHDISAGLALDQGHDLVRHCFHDALVLFGVAVPVVNAADATLGVVLDSVHGVAPEAERGDGRAVGPAQVVRRCPLDLELGADRAHGGVEAPDRSAASRAGKDKASRCVVGQLGDDVLRRLGQPHAMALAILGAGPAGRRHRLAPPFP